MTKITLDRGGTEANSKHLHAQKLWSGHDAHASSLIILLTDKFGPDDFEWMSWAPETLRIEIKEGFGVEPSRQSMDRLMGGIAILTTDKFLTSLPSFIDICNSVAGEGISYEFDPADVAEISWTVVESVLLTQEAPEFSEEITAYIEEQIKSEGLGQVPKVLRSIVSTKVNDPASVFSDDPVMYQSVFDMAHDEAREIDDTIAEELQDLIREIERLPLRHGNAADMAKAVRSSLSL